MQKQDITTKIETVTPETAKEYLARNTKNRHLRQRLVQTLASEMLADRFLLTHQGIAFDQNGNLIDGQHRLQACILANVPFRTFVTRGLPVKISKDSITIHTMDLVDRGAVRTIGDQLNLRHGYLNGSKVAGAVATIAKICTEGFGGLFMTIPKTLSILRIYGEEVKYCCQNCGRTLGIRSSCVAGAFAFAMKVEPERIKELHVQVVEGENIRKGMPGYALRYFLINSATNSGGCFPAMTKTLAVLTAARSFIAEEKLRTIRLSKLGLDFWTENQKSNVAKIEAMFSKIEEKQEIQAK